MDKQYRFEIHREEDKTGVSGTGIVATGVRLPTGRCVMEWAGDLENSIVTWSSVDAMQEVVTHRGKDKTKIHWVDPIPPNVRFSQADTYKDKWTDLVSYLKMELEYGQDAVVRVDTILKQMEEEWQIEE